MTVLVKVAGGASALPIAAVETPGATLPLVVLFYLGCVPAAISTLVFPEERCAWWGGVALLWAALWIVLVAALSLE